MIQELVGAPWVVLVVEVDLARGLVVRVTCRRCAATGRLREWPDSPRLELEAFAVVERLRTFHRQHQLCPER